MRRYFTFSVAKLLTDLVDLRLNLGFSHGCGLPLVLICSSNAAAAFLRRLWASGGTVSRFLPLTMVTYDGKTNYMHIFVASLKCLHTLPSKSHQIFLATATSATRASKRNAGAPQCSTEKAKGGTDDGEAHAALPGLLQRAKRTRHCSLRWAEHCRRSSSWRLASKKQHISCSFLFVWSPHLDRLLSPWLSRPSAIPSLRR